MDQELLPRLEALKQRDLDTRNRLLKEGRLYGVYAEELQQVHSGNALALNGIIGSHGWPGISRIGLRGSWTAWLIAQHAICTPDLQRRFLVHLSRAEQVGEVPAKQVPGPARPGTLSLRVTGRFGS